ncbi:MAG: phage holin family protein [Deltaproteobacteria bacterium]|nr:phage holin family protein [Deltaproteobacteria bacterium]
MNVLLLRWLTLTLAVIVTAYLLDGIRVSGFFSAVLAAAALATLNTFLRPVILVLTLPINVLTLGLFTFVINAVLLKMASAAIPGFDVIGFWPAVWGALLISIVAGLMNAFIGKHMPPRTPRSGRDNAAKVINLENKGDNRWE